MVKVMKKKRVRVRRVGTLISSTITKKQKQNKTKNKTKTEKKLKNVLYVESNLK